MNETEKKILSLVGLATKAGKIASGEFQTEAAIKDRTAKIVLIAEDASENTKKLFLDKSSFYGIPSYFIGTKETLGRAIGKEYRAVLAVSEEGLADAIQKKITMQNGQE